MLRPVAVRSTTISLLSIVALSAMLALSGCGRLRASSIPLGGKHEEDAPAAKVAAGGSVASAAPRADEESAAAQAEEVVVQAPASAPSAEPTESAKGGQGAATGAFTLRPYASGQMWTRVLDAEFDIKLGPGMDMRITNHQEARFEVLAASAGNIDKLAIEYPVDVSKMTMMGRETEEQDDLAGKRYVVTFTQGKADIKSAGGGTPSKKELDNLKDDAREPQAMAAALKELASLTAKGKGDFSLAGVIALAGGEDDDTKITAAKASLRKLAGAPSGEKSAVLDVAYTLTGSSDDDIIIEMQLAGTMVVLDAPARYQSITMRGPVEIRPKQPGGMEGRGTSKVTLTYK